MYVPYLGYEDSRLTRIVIAVEVTADASFQIFGLTHIDYCPVLIKVLIATRTLGNALQNAFYMLFACGHSILIRVVMSTPSGNIARPCRPSMVNSIMKLMNISFGLNCCTRW